MSLYPGAVSAITRSAFPTAATARAHAAALAKAILPKKTTTAAPKYAPTPTPPPYVPPAATSGTSLVDYLKSLLGTPMTTEQQTATAQQQARDAVTAMVAPYLLQQQRAQEREAAQADLIRQGSAAVAQSLQPLGDVTHKDYQDAITALGAIGQGYTGQLRTDAAAEAAANQATFDKLNMPATATNLGDPLSQAVYASGVAIPATPLASAGAAQTLAARALPGQVTAAGEQQVNLSNNQYENKIQDIADQITGAYGQIPSLTQQYLTSIQDQESKKISQTLDILGASKPIQIGSASTGYQLLDPFTYKVVGTIPPAPGAYNRVTTRSLPDGRVAVTTYNTLTSQSSTKIVGKVIPALVNKGSGKPFAYGVHGLATLTIGKDGKPHLTVIRQPDSPVTTELTTISGIPTVVTHNIRTGKTVVTKHPELAQPKVEFHSLGRGAWIQTSTDPKTGVMTITDRATGQPYPVDKFKNPDGTYQIVGWNQKTGKAFTFTAGIAKVVPPTIHANKVDGGYDILNTNTGALIKHIPGNVARTKPRIIATPKKGGWDVVDPYTGQLIYHHKGPPQAGAGAGGGLTAAGKSVAFGRVNAVAANAVKHVPAKKFDITDSASALTGTQQSATPLNTAIAKALRVAPKSVRAQLQAAGIVVGSYQGIRDEMTQFIQDPDIQSLLPQEGDSPDQLAANAREAFTLGQQLGFPSDLLGVMIGTAFGLPGFFTPPEGMPQSDFLPHGGQPGHPEAAVDWYINSLVGQLPTAQTTAATRGGGSYPFGTSNLGSAALDSFLRNQGSPLAGMGGVFVEAGKRYNVDPALMIAISGAESGFGAKPRGSYNYWGIGPGMDFASPGDSINEFAKLLRSYMNKGLTTIDQIGAKWAPIGAKNDPKGLNRNWVPNVQSILQGMGASPVSQEPVSFKTEGKKTALTNGAIQLVRTYLGTPYVWGGENPGGFDCSGLIQYVWGQQGVVINRTTYQQWDQGHPVEKANLMPGDAVFFTGSDPKGGKPGHEGMYIGGGKFIEAPGSGGVVRISNLAGRGDYVGARRFV